MIGMDLISGAIMYFEQNQAAFWQATRQHLLLSMAALALAAVICLPAGVWIAHRPRTAPAVLSATNALRVLPSLVVLFLALPYLGIGSLPALAALTALAGPPILINTWAGIRQVDGPVLESARGMGMTARQILLQVELPLSAASILTGLRIAAVEVISSATLAALIGGGGLGDFITRGFALYDFRVMLVGAVPVALLALTVELLFSTAIRPFRARSTGSR